MSGYLSEDFAQVGLTDRRVVNAGLGDINDVFNDKVRHKRLTGRPSHDAGWLGYWLLQHEFENGTASKQGDTDERNRSVVSAICNRRTHGCDEQRSRREHMRNMNNGSLKPCTLTTRRVVPNDAEVINCWNNRRTALTLDTCRGEIMVRSELVLAPRFTRVACEVCNRWKMMIA